MEEYGGGGMGCKSSEASVFSLSSISKEHATMPCWKQDTRLGGAVVWPCRAFFSAVLEPYNVFLWKVLIVNALNSHKDNQGKIGSKCVNTALLIPEMFMYFKVWSIDSEMAACYCACY